jgi:phospholipase C
LPFPDRQPGTINEEMPFDHIVVVMMENHSFDNLLGALPLTNPAVDGLTFENGAATNWNPGAGNLPSRVSAYRLETTEQASDVSQTWKEAHEQINGGAMDGFVKSTGARQPMGYYTPEVLPFAYSLASTFTVGTRWFCSLPGPTYPNRRFLLAGTAYGCTVTNSDTLLDHPPANGTICDLLSKHNIPWCNYFSDIPMTMVIPSTIIDHPDRHLPVTSFFEHCRQGTLPAVSFVDPRIGVLSRIGQPIAALPPLFRDLLARIGVDLANADSAETEEDPQDMYWGEKWAQEVVEAVLTSPCWPRTLLIYTYDEHGGYYDHVPPPPAIAPDDIPPKLQPGDPAGSYTIYGPRVPAIVVSPYAKPGGVTEVIHDHTSVLATIEAKWNLPALSARDANAQTVMDFLDTSTETFRDPPTLVGPSPTGPSGPVSATSSLREKILPSTPTSKPTPTPAATSRAPDGTVPMPKSVLPIAILWLLALIGLFVVWHKSPNFRGWFPTDLGRVPVEAIWFAAVGGSLVSFTGIFKYNRRWLPSYTYWHWLRPVIAAFTGAVACLLLTILLNSAVSPGTPYSPTLYEAGGFFFGYNESAFRELLKQAGNLFVRPGGTESTTPGGQTAGS